jgi:hypothetical protein
VSNDTNVESIISNPTQFFEQTYYFKIAPGKWGRTIIRERNYSCCGDIALLSHKELIDRCIAHERAAFERRWPCLGRERLLTGDNNSR